MDNLLISTESSLQNKLACTDADLNGIIPNSNFVSSTKEISNLSSLEPTLERIMQTTAYFGRAMPIWKTTEKENTASSLNSCPNLIDNYNPKLIQCSNVGPPTHQPIVALKSSNYAKVATAAAAMPPKRQLTPKPSEHPEVRNVIASTNLGCRLDLRFIAMHAKNVEYNPKMRDVLLMRIRRPFCLAFIYSSGKLICTGTKSCQAARLAARKFARVIQKLGIPIRFTRSRVDNIIASCKLQSKIRLEALELFRHKQCVYEPELFPCLVYRLPRLGSQIFVFSSGTIVLCNIKKTSKIQESFLEFYAIVQPFMKA